ncbi:hypothetical protein LCGC14_0826830 [marine sediment metagenome]|uniref:Uncharacterized protein n=1 Tax=marine sediment metagenome TaxID=412755 RepID=A0A0F9PLX0_9ZZZZ
MTGGNYFTWFKEEGSERRKLLYQLEDLGIVELIQERERKGLYGYKWELAKKGKELVDKDKELQKLLQDGNIQEFYQKIVSLLENLKEEK